MKFIRIILTPTTNNHYNSIFQKYCDENGQTAVRQSYFQRTLILMFLKDVRWWLQVQYISQLCQSIFSPIFFNLVLWETSLNFEIQIYGSTKGAQIYLTHLAHLVFLEILPYSTSPKVRIYICFWSMAKLSQRLCAFTLEGCWVGAPRCLRVNCDLLECRRTMGGPAVPGTTNKGCEK